MIESTVLIVQRDEYLVGARVSTLTCLACEIEPTLVRVINKNLARLLQVDGDLDLSAIAFVYDARELFAPCVVPAVNLDHLGFKPRRKIVNQDVSAISLLLNELRS